MRAQRRNNERKPTERRGEERKKEGREDDGIEDGGGEKELRGGIKGEMNHEESSRVEGIADGSRGLNMRLESEVKE